MVENCPQRRITQEFKQQLLSGGILWPLLQRVQHDDTLSLEIRNNYIDIYYRGGRLLGVHAQANASKFRTEFDKRYCEVKKEYRPILPERPPRLIAAPEDAQAWVDSFSFYKQVMDIRFTEHPKMEREYQQSVVRDNNRHKSGDVTDYVIIDIEYAQSPRAFPEQNCNYRFDMVGFRWPAKGKTRASRLVTPVIVEKKIGEGALASRGIGENPDDLSPGLVKHVLDIERFLTPDEGEKLSKPYRLLCRELQEIFETKKSLGLPSLPRAMSNLSIDGISERPEVLFILNSYNPTSKALRKELGRLSSYERADYGIAMASYMGYALFAEKIVPLDEFITHMNLDASGAHF